MYVNLDGIRTTFLSLVHGKMPSVLSHDCRIDYRPPHFNSSSNADAPTYLAFVDRPRSKKDTAKMVPAFSKMVLLFYLCSSPWQVAKVSSYDSRIDYRPHAFVLSLGIDAPTYLAFVDRPRSKEVMTEMVAAHC